MRQWGIRRRYLRSAMRNAYHLYVFAAAAANVGGLAWAAVPRGATFGGLAAENTNHFLIKSPPC